jgi:hypothetical protein
MTATMKVWRSTQGQGFGLHSSPNCSGGAGPNKVRRFSITREMFDAALAERKVVALGGAPTGLRLCKCIRTFRPEEQS